MMSLLKWKKRVIKPFGRPFKRSDEVALLAVGTVSGILVIWFIGGEIILTVTIDTLNAKRIKTKQRGGIVAIVAIGGNMPSDQWKTTLLVYFGDIFYQPAFCSVASFTFEAYRGFMHILVAGEAFRFCIRKHQFRMALKAIGFGMLSG
jgi:hypothetical protein